MAKRFGVLFGTWLYHKCVIKYEQIDDIRFAFEIIISEGIEIIIVIVFSLITGNVIESITFLIVFHLLREVYQGYHATTVMRCLFLTTFVYLVVISISIYLESWLAEILLLLMTLFLLCYAFIKKNFVPFIISISVLFTVQLMAIIFINCHMVQIVVLTHIVVLISMIPERRT